MRSYTFISHTADIRIKLEASSLSELLIAGAEALAVFLCPDIVKASSFPIVTTIELSSTDSTSLLIDFLSEILTQSSIAKTVFYRVSFDVCEETHLKATLCGAPQEHFAEDIKAITYHEAQITRNNEGVYSTILVCDI